MVLKKLVHRKVEPPEKTAEEFAQEWASALGPNLVSVVLYGSVVSGDYRPGHSTLRLLVVVKRLDGRVLDLMAPLVARWEERGVATPRVFTPVEVLLGARGLALEFLDILESHRVLRGSDPFEGIEVQRADVRSRLEAEVDYELQRLRRLYLEHSPRPRDLSEPLADMAATLAPIARGLLYLKGKSGPLSRKELFEGAVAEYNLTMTGFERALALRDDRVEEDQMALALLNLMGLFEKLQEVLGTLPR
ncbi:MAG: hypothetical protein HY558_00780 [Euryarchaeota archaeon]|nr:hypothetical protein [Euryarchaeota archaeon]